MNAESIKGRPSLVLTRSHSLASISSLASMRSVSSPSDSGNRDGISILLAADSIPMAPPINGTSISPDIVKALEELTAAVSSAKNTPTAEAPSARVSLLKQPEAPTIPDSTTTVSPRQSSRGMKMNARFSEREKTFTIVINDPEHGDIGYELSQYFFTRDSPVFASRLRDPDTGFTLANVTILVEDVSPSELDAFLSLLYPKNFKDGDLTEQSEWIAVLKIATRWSFQSIRELAIIKLNLIIQSPTVRLDLARTYSVQEWIDVALAAICLREEPLSLLEITSMASCDVALVSYMHKKGPPANRLHTMFAAWRRETLSRAIGADASLLAADESFARTNAPPAEDWSVTASRPPVNRPFLPPPFPAPWPPSRPETPPVPPNQPASGWGCRRGAVSPSYSEAALPVASESPEASYQGGKWGFSTATGSGRATLSGPTFEDPPEPENAPSRPAVGKKKKSIKQIGITGPVG